MHLDHLMIEERVKLVRRAVLLSKKKTKSKSIFSDCYNKASNDSKNKKLQTDSV